MADALFTREQLMEYQEFLVYKDLIRAITQPGELLTKAQLAKRIQATAEKEVK